MPNVTFRICTPTEKMTATNFLWSLKEEFLFTEQSAVEEITELLFEKGGVIGGYQAAEMVGLFGYLLGEPSRDFTNKDVGFIYVAGLAKPVRGTGVFRHGARSLLITLKALGVRELRCHAAEDNPFTNRLYARFGQPIAKEKNRRGINCILYANTIEAIIADFSRAKKPKAIRNPADKEVRLSRS